MASAFTILLLSWQTMELAGAAMVSSGPCHHCARRARSTRPQMQMEVEATQALLSSPSAVLGAIDSFYRNSPVEAAALTCGAKAAASDTISQRRAALVAALETRDSFCWSRNAAFTAYGAIYTGCVQHYLYNEVYPHIFGSGTSMATVLQEVAFDNFVHAPLLCLPTLYLLKAIVFEQPLAEGLSKYVSDARGDLLLKYWAVWIPSQCLTFSVVPEHLRIAFVAFVSFFWLIILSTISSREAAADAATPPS